MYINHIPMHFNESLPHLRHAEDQHPLTTMFLFHFKSNGILPLNTENHVTPGPRKEHQAFKKLGKAVRSFGNLCGGPSSQAAGITNESVSK